MRYVSLKYRDRRSLTLSGKEEITKGTNDEYKYLSELELTMIYEISYEV